MAFLKEGAVKDLVERGPSFDDLLDWASENILYGQENPFQKIMDYANQHGMTIQEFETFINIQLAALANNDDQISLDSQDVLLDLLANIVDEQGSNEIIEDKSYYPRLR